MPGFKSIIDQSRPKRILTTLLENGTIPHALLFTGIEGVGKNMAATAFAMASNCLAGDYRQINQAEEIGKANAVEPCGQCRSCRKIESANHPDIIRPGLSFPKSARYDRIPESQLGGFTQSGWHLTDQTQLSRETDLANQNRIGAHGHIP